MKWSRMRRRRRRKRWSRMRRRRRRGRKTKQNGFTQIPR